MQLSHGWRRECFSSEAFRDPTRIPAQPTSPSEEGALFPSVHPKPSDKLPFHPGILGSNLATRVLLPFSQVACVGRTYPVWQWGSAHGPRLLWGAGPPELLLCESVCKADKTLLTSKVSTPTHIWGLAALWWDSRKRVKCSAHVPRLRSCIFVWSFVSPWMRL
jgi:hypothetical protein